jgi:hypothetical protein
MNSKKVIINLLDNETILKNIILKTLPQDYEILSSFAPAIYKAHWIYKYINELCVFDLFTDRHYNRLDDDEIIKILHTIIQTVGEFQFYTLDDAYSNISKNTPLKQKNKDLKTIQAFSELLNSLELGGKIKMYYEKKENYDINLDKGITLDISHIRMFLEHLTDEIKAVDGNDKITFTKPYNLGIRYKYHNPKLDGLKRELKKRLIYYVKCKTEYLNISINSLVNDFLQKNKRFLS